jgi:hypothetical protein
VPRERVVALTLAAVAALTLLARRALVGLMTRYGASMDRLSRGLDMIADLLLIVIGMGELRHMRIAASLWISRPTV